MQNSVAISILILKIHDNFDFIFNNTKIEFILTQLHRYDIHVFTNHEIICHYFVANVNVIITIIIITTIIIIIIIIDHNQTNNNNNNQIHYNHLSTICCSSTIIVIAILVIVVVVILFIKFHSKNNHIIN